ncbi:MAG: STAS domain-containing protein [Bacilli bacterium]|nr:STAS domain-containing protein [Bacilli bacterium]
MEITKEIQGNNIVLKVSGRVDTSNSNQLEEATKDIKEDEFLVLDFQNLEYLSSVGLRILLSLKKRLKDNIKIININAFIKEVFEMTGFSDIFTNE